MKKRTNYFIYPKFQLPIILGGVIPLLLVLGGIYLRFRASFDRLELHMKALGTHTNPKVLNAIQAQEILVQKYFISGAVIGLIVIAVVSILVSHKMAGPIYRLKLELKKLRAGESFVPIKFREGDYLVNMEDDLNFCLSEKLDEKDKAS
jgi:signal transduction histidine kinase